MSAITFEELKSKLQSKLNKDSEVTCKLLVKLKDGYLVDINDEWEGTVPNGHFTNGHETEPSLGETFQALIISGADKTDRYVVSPKALKEKSAWEKLEKLKEEGNPFKVTISKVIKGGAEVYIDGVRAFLPGRYIRLPGISQDNWVNQEIEVLIEELDYKEKKIILNQKKAVDIEKQKKAEITIHKLKEGDIVEAPVLRVADFGIFVDLGGLDGLIPASELSWGRFNHPKDVVRTGQVIQARIFRIEKENLRVALSVKQLLGDPWEQVENELAIGDYITGKVINEAPFGLFIELKPGVEALLHNSEIPEGIEKPKTGSTITAKLVKLDADQRKVGLSLKNMEQLTENKNTTIEPTEPNTQSSVLGTPSSKEPVLIAEEVRLETLEDLQEINSENGKLN